MRPLLGKIASNVVSEAVRKRKNKAKSWKYGYDSEFDIVVISKDGTLGEIYRMEGINIGLPAIPEDKTKIINHDLPPHKQKWKREEMPARLRQENQNEYYDYIVEEFRRRREGVFIYIGGEIEYFPGCYYFFVQWHRIKRDYPHFRYTQKDLMLFWEACYADQRCYGILYVKNRRLGWSTMNQSEVNNRSTVFKDGFVGIISKTGKDAKSFFRKTVTSFRRLPFFFKPSTDGTTNPKTELAFIKPAKRITHKSDHRNENHDEALNTFITHYATDLNAMDGEQIAPIQIIEEPGKFPTQVPFSQYWDVAKECLVEGDEIVGKSMIGSTINPPEQGGNEFKIVWDQSDPTERDGNDETKSGLYRIFIPADYNMRGFFDEFGFPIVEDPEKPYKNNEGKIREIGAKTYLDNKEDALAGNPELLAERKRKYPRTIIDAFRSANTDCSFNAAKIYEQLDYINHMMPKNMIIRGDLKWEGGIPDTTVKFVHNPDGLFQFSYMLPKELQNNIVGGQYGKNPGNKQLGAIGVDPYNRSKTAFGVGSKAAMHGFLKDNAQGLPGSFFFFQYYGRPRKVELFYEDVIKAMVFTGMPLAIEQSNDELLKILKSRGYRPCVLTRPGVIFNDLNPTEKELGGFPPQNEKIGNAQFYAVEAYIDDYFGIAEKEGNRKKGELGKFYFFETANQLLTVDPEKRTKFDLYISMSLALIVCQRKVVHKKTKPTAIMNPLPKYTQGRTSKKIQPKRSA